jgi:diacylglycerol kinase (ATP)
MVPGVESLLVVINSDADGTDEHLAEAAVDALRTEADVQVCHTRAGLPGDLDGALQRRGGRTVVVIGGDGYLHTVVAALHRRNELDDTLLAVLPVGVSSDFACGSGIPPDPQAAADVVLRGVERRFDLLIDCRGSVVVNDVRLGRYKRQRPAPSPFHVRIEADDAVVADFDRPVLEVAVTNATSPTPVQPVGPSLRAPGIAGAAAGTVAGTLDDGYVTGAPASLLADPSDGLADVVVCFAVGALATARRLLRRPHPFRRDDMLTVRARRISVVGQRFWVRSDGQDTGTEQRCTWNVVPRSLRMIVPSPVPS